MGKPPPLKKDLEKDANLITKKKGIKIHLPKVSLKSRKKKSVAPVDISSDVVTHAITSNHFAALETIEEDKNEVVNVEEEGSIEEVFAEELGDHRSDAIQNVLLPLVSGDSLGLDKYYDDGIIGKNSEMGAVDDIERDVWSEGDLDDAKTHDSAQGESYVPKKCGRKSKEERARAQAGLVPRHSPRLQ
ncbi:OLC1v1008467C1 [Oldenlandia corymbosa var. corymbosa]|uniref:OLC1v1008467C1 n=1 Tax=Oldenlandia corymbosa var. corymbosa TaxID=529605 RepID=A0AAV1DM81_OLDCO|nr:OLC1v1008467C1 [Oldenlandia corymbosa var. corymbosa]